MYRQGDVIIIPVEAFPTNTTEVLRDGGRIILAAGEVTGHHHAIASEGAALLAAPNTDDRFLRIMDASGVTLTHEEHAPIVLPAGNYVVRIQREYTSANMPPIRVAD